MDAGISTGGAQDYIWLHAETIKECATLLHIAQSQFIPPGTVHLLALDFPPTVELRIPVGAPRSNQIDAETRDAIDNTP